MFNCDGIIASSSLPMSVQMRLVWQNMCQKRTSTVASFIIISLHCYEARSGIRFSRLRNFLVAGNFSPYKVQSDFGLSTAEVTDQILVTIQIYFLHYVHYSLWNGCCTAFVQKKKARSSRGITFLSVLPFSLFPSLVVEIDQGFAFPNYETTFLRETSMRPVSELTSGYLL